MNTIKLDDTCRDELILMCSERRAANIKNMDDTIDKISLNGVDDTLASALAYYCKSWMVMNKCVIALTNKDI